MIHTTWITFFDKPMLAIPADGRVRLRTNPGDPNHRKVRKIANNHPYFEVEDRDGNTGMYRLDQMELA